MPGRHMEGLPFKSFTPLHKHKLCGITAEIAALSLLVLSRLISHFFSFGRIFLSFFWAI